MTSVSGISSTTPTYVSRAATANNAMKSLLTGTSMTNMLAMQSSADAPPTAKLTTSTLWMLFNSSNNDTIGLSNVQTAVRTAGGSPTDADAIWSQLSPGGNNTVSLPQFTNSSFVKSAVSTNLAFIQKNVSAALANDPLTAEKTVQLLMNSPDVIKSLASQSTRWTPPSTAQVLSTLWAVFNVNSTKVITKADVQAGVNAEGGTPSDANALWKQLDPNNTGAVGANQFVNNAYMQDAIQINLATTQANVANAQLIDTGTSNSVLDSFSSGGASVLTGASTGYNGSAVGSGKNFNYLNLFV